MSTLIVEDIKKRSDTTVYAGAVHLLESQTASSSATIDFSLPSGYFKFEIVISNIVPATNNTDLDCRLSTDGGSSFLSGASEYSYNRGAQTETYRHFGTAYHNSASAVDAIRFLYSSGNIASGTFKLYGWVDGS